MQFFEERSGKPNWIVMKAVGNPCVLPTSCDKSSSEYTDSPPRQNSKNSVCAGLSVESPCEPSSKTK